MTSDDSDSDSKKEGGGTFAEQLGNLDIEVSEESTSDEVASDEQDVEETEEPDEEELFRQAVEGLSEEEIREAKYGGAPADDERTRQESSEDAERSESEPGTSRGDEVSDDRLAEQLGQLDVEVREEPQREESDAPQPAPDAGPSPRETFEEAIEGMSATEMRRQKYDLPNRDRSGEKPRKREENEAEQKERQRREEEARKEIVRRRENRKFEQAMRDVERSDKESKYRERSTPDPDEYFNGGSVRTAEDFVTPTLPKSGEGLSDAPPLNDAQEALLARCDRAERKGGIPECNLRGEPVEEALDELREFVRSKRAAGHQFARIVHGRGLNSDGPPVLKPAVLEWLETHAASKIRGYAPERTMGGDYGSIVIEFLDR